jgi:hypothetical protein
VRERATVVAELVRFLMARRAWWLMPIVIALLIVAALAVVGTAAPIFYPLF